MSLTFSAAHNDARVNHGSDASLDNQNVGTLLCWCNPTAASGQMASKLGTGHMVFQLFGTGQINLEYERDSDLNNIKTRSNTGYVSNDVWQFLGGTYDVNGANGDQRLFHGDLSTIVTEAASYSTQTVGSGAHGDDSADDFIVGSTKNLGAGNVFNGQIAWFAFWNRQLTIGEIKAQQFGPYPTSGCVLFAHYGLHPAGGAQPDWSGSSNNGTVSLATATGHPPHLIRANLRSLPVMAAGLIPEVDPPVADAPSLGGSFLETGMLKKHDIAIATHASAGTATVYSGRVAGRVVAIKYVPGTIATGADLTITGEDSAVPILVKANAGTSDVWFYPAVALNLNTDGSALSSWTSPAVYSERLKLAVAQGDNSKAGSIEFYTEE